LLKKSGGIYYRMAANDELSEIYHLARRALECQEQLGHKEIIFEAGHKSGAGPESGVQASSADVQSSSYNQMSLLNEEPSGPGEPEYNSLEEHRAAICNCTKCSLSQTRTKFVYGAGSSRAKIVFIGEAPGREEDLQGEPFVGRAGKLLDNILAAIKFTRRDVYIGNILKCRPPENRDPQPEEIRACMPHLIEQIRIIKPLIICALGRIAAHCLLDTTTPLGKLRGTWHSFQGIPLIVTYHPAALLRFQQYKRPTWEDMQEMKARYEKFSQG